MEDAKRRALIKSQAVKKRESGEEVPKVSASVPKRKLTTKSDRPFKQPKVSIEPVVGLMAEGIKTVTPAKKGTGKGLMTAPEGKQERPPSLLRDDSKYALEKLSSIITAEDYEDLGNHSTEAMGETGLFAVAQVGYVISLYIYFFCCYLHHVTVSFLLAVLGHDEGSTGPVSQP